MIYKTLPIPEPESILSDPIDSKSSYYYIPVACSEYFGKKRPLVVCIEECPWQTIALMMENLYLKNRMNTYKNNVIVIIAGR